MAGCWKAVVLVTLTVVCLSKADVETPSLMVQLEDGAKGFNISIPDAGKEMEEFKYYVSLNQEFTGATNLYTKGRVECFSDKSRFRLRKQRDMSEGNTLHFYLVGHRKAGNFQMERVYEIRKNEEGVLEFQQKSERAGLETEGLWYQLDNLEENNP
uniref:Lipocalin/cytosolic fatty-acid binding domain-containing protein n=1 Tax=Graphocephala atropunctata TaxID=36148 RepID=A0A1B6L4A9_9HEMI